MICPKCGFNEVEGSQFCGNCGHAFGTAPTPPQGIPAPPPLPPDAGAWTASQPPVPPPKKSKLVPALIAVCALLLVGIVVVVLIFTVFKGDGEKKEEGDGKQAASEPVEVAEAYLKALEERDLRALLDLIDPDTLEDLEDEYGKEYRDILEGFFFASLPEGLEFKGLKFSQEIEDDEAEVFIEEGTATYVDEEGEKQTLDLAEVMEGALELVKRDGTWYITMDGFDDWEDYLKSYAGDVDGDGGEDGDKDDDRGEENTLVFDSMLVGVSFRYPKGWTPSEYPEGLVEISPDEAPDKAKVTVSYQDLSGVSYGMEDWIQDRADEFESQGWSYDFSYTTLLGNEAGQVIFSYLGEDSYGYKVMDVFTVVGDVGYYVSYIALEEYFDTYLDSTETIIDSMELLAP